MPLGAFDHERLEVWREAMALHLAAMAALRPRGSGVLRAQVERSSPGVVLNIAEGRGRTSPADKRRFYEIARGSATETVAALEVASARGLADAGTVACARGHAGSVVRMLSRLCGAGR